MTKKVLALLFVLSFVLAGVATGVNAQEGERWTGANPDWKVNPLPCPGEEAPATAEEPVPYNGGLPTNPPDLKGKEVVAVDVPKLIGIAYFNATAKGIQEAAAEVNLKVTTDGPTEGDVTKQIEFLDRYVTQGVQAILFASNDPVAIAPTLRDALAQGIYVIGYDADAEPDARSWFVNQTTFNGFSKALMDNMVEQIGPEGSFAIVTSSFTAPNQSAWIAEAWAYTQKCYPDLKWLETVESQEDQQLAFERTKDLINKYGADMDGVIGFSSVASPAAAEAVQELKLCPPDADPEYAASDPAAAVYVVALSTPNQMSPYVKNACVKKVTLWNPVDLGYAAGYALRAQVDGTLTPESTELDAGRLGKLKVINGSEILLGPPFDFTKDNIDNFDF
jgi:rhamnose transport system substrate-binding protein